MQSKDCFIYLNLSNNFCTFILAMKGELKRTEENKITYIYT